MPERFDLEAMEKRILEKLRPPKPVGLPLLQRLREVALRRKPRVPRI